MTKVVLTVKLEVEKAEVLASLLRLAAWREFQKAGPQRTPGYLRHERLLKDLAFDLQCAINTYNKEVTK